MTKSPSNVLSSVGVAASTCLLLGAAAWCWHAEVELRQVLRRAAEPQFSSHSADNPPPGSETLLEDEAPPDHVWSVNRRAFGELFDPPTMERLADGRVVAFPRGEESDPVALPVRLLAMRAIPARWQWVGRVGSDAGAIATFSDLRTGRTVFVQAGARVGDSDLTLLAAESPPAGTIAAANSSSHGRAVKLRDERTGHDVVLSATGVTISDEWEAQLEVHDGVSSATVWIRCGDEVNHAGTTFVVREIAPVEDEVRLEETSDPSRGLTITRAGAAVSVSAAHSDREPRPADGASAESGVLTATNS